MKGALVQLHLIYWTFKEIQTCWNKKVDVNRVGELSMDIR